METGFSNGFRPHASHEERNKAYEQNLRSFREADIKRDEWVTSLIKDNIELRHKIEETYDNYENEVRSRQEWQRQCREQERELMTLRNSIASRPFVVALIDGDGAPFIDDILQAGQNGGGKAAALLEREITHYVAGIDGHSAGANWSIMVHIFANLDGLARKLYACGKISGQAEFTRMIQEFNSTASLFNFVDVGQGKERADNRMREMFRFYYFNPQCKHIIFGGCHDTGYDNTLRQYKHDPEASNRISLLETTPAHFTYRQYQVEANFKMIQFPSVFRSEPLPDKPQQPPPNMIPQAALAIRQPVPQTNIMPAAMPRPVAPLSASNPALANPSVSPTIRTIPTSVPPRQMSTTSTTSPEPRLSRSATTPQPSNNPSTWATVGKNGAVQSNYTIAPTKKPPPPKAILLNVEHERIDKPLEFSKADDKSLWERINKNQKVCNEYFLKGKCDKGDSCQYSHEGELTPGQKNALRYRARTLPCSESDQCRDFDCYQGHHCREDDCGRDNCYWEWSHGMNKQIAFKFLQDGQYLDFDEKQPYPIW